MAVSYLPKGSTDSECAGGDFDVIDWDSTLLAATELEVLPQSNDRLHELLVVEPAAVKKI
jgi:hypothetical protein